jgi:hypothetical protein
VRTWLLLASAGILFAGAIGLGVVADSPSPESLEVTGYGSIYMMGSSNPTTAVLSGIESRWVFAAVSALKVIPPGHCMENADVFFFQEVRNGNVAWSGADFVCPGAVTFGPLHRTYQNTCTFLTEIASIFPTGQATASKKYARQWCGMRASAHPGVERRTS